MTAKKVVVTDASVAINFSHVDLLVRLPELTSMNFVVTDVVYDER